MTDVKPFPTEDGTAAGFLSETTVTAATSPTGRRYTWNAPPLELWLPTSVSFRGEPCVWIENRMVNVSPRA